MKNILWVSAVFLAFIAGYFTRGINQEIPTIPSQAKITQQSNLATDLQTSKEQLSEAAKAVIAQKEKTNPKAQHSQSVSEHPIEIAALPQAASAPSPAQSLDTNNPTTKEYPNEISDEEVDQLLPKPFDASLKKLHGPLKEKYKGFTDTDHNKKDNWDIRMQSQLTDFVLSRPSATDIKIDSINCNDNMCEVRLTEQKKFLLLALFGELMQQSWIINKVAGNADVQPDIGYGYILLMRKDD